jgi:hypothetical protein
MIAFSRRSTLSPPVTRHFEFTRLQDQLIALAYQSLIPVISCPLKRQQGRLGRNQQTTVQRFQSKAGGV